MTRKHYEFIEEFIDKNGVKRVYGYGMNGDTYLINIREVMMEYSSKKLKGFTVVA